LPCPAHLDSFRSNALPGTPGFVPVPGGHLAPATPAFVGAPATPSAPAGQGNPNSDAPSPLKPMSPDAPSPLKPTSHQLQPAERSVLSPLFSPDAPSVRSSVVSPDAFVGGGGAYSGASGSSPREAQKSQTWLVNLPADVNLPLAPGSVPTSTVATSTVATFTTDATFTDAPTEQATETADAEPSAKRRRVKVTYGAPGDETVPTEPTEQAPTEQATATLPTPSGGAATR